MWIDLGFFFILCGMYVWINLLNFVVLIFLNVGSIYIIGLLGLLNEILEEEDII